jgi:two-component system chemotaxis response regulator CheY
MATEEITKRGVLVADSTPNMAALVAQMLRTLGRKDIREAYDASKAMLEIRRRTFDILIIDADLNELDGVAFTKKLRSMTDNPNHDMPVIMMSSAPDAKRIAAARDAGITEFLRKPFAASHLNSRLVNIEANPRGFIQSTAYVGPDRRRKTIDVGDKDRRDAKAG